MGNNWQRRRERKWRKAHPELIYTPRDLRMARRVVILAAIVLCLSVIADAGYLTWAYNKYHHLHAPGWSFALLATEFFMLMGAVVAYRYVRKHLSSRPPSLPE